LSDSGLELCGFDYCIVQDAVREAGLGVTMSRLANTYLAEDDARLFADALIEYLGVDPVTVEVVDHLERRIAGQYDTASRHITLERPTRAWIVLHEVAHAIASGHGEEFQETAIELADWVSRESP
jgi:predicted metal-dependent hydrolase